MLNTHNTKCNLYEKVFIKDLGRGAGFLQYKGDLQGNA